MRRRGLARVNVHGWMMSYADMVTILLAMFIVLCTLGRDQTGVSLQKGLDSLRDSQRSFGLGGVLPDSDRLLEGDGTLPHYPMPGADGDPDNPAGRSIDGELEKFQRFLGEVGQHLTVDRAPPTAGEAVVDLFTPLNAAPPYLTDRHRETIGPVLAVLARANYQVTVVVWAAMPTEQGWQRAAERAAQVADEMAAGAALDAAARARLLAAGQTWPHRDYQRPVVSMVIRKYAPPRGPGAPHAEGQGPKPPQAPS